MNADQVFEAVCSGCASVMFQGGREVTAITLGHDAVEALRQYESLMGAVHGFNPSSPPPPIDERPINGHKWQRGSHLGVAVFYRRIPGKVCDKCDAVTDCKRDENGKWLCISCFCGIF